VEWILLMLGAVANTLVGGAIGEVIGGPNFESVEI
jgi:hypothetical protein